MPKLQSSLTVRVCLLLVLAALLPLLITVIISELLSRPLLISQASQGMEVDAQSRQSQIDSYIWQHVQDISAISQFQGIQSFIQGTNDNTIKTSIYQELVWGHHADPYDDSWTLFDAQGDIRLSYPKFPQMRGKSFSDAIQHLYKAQFFLYSDVFYDQTTNAASFDIYEPVQGAPDQSGKAPILGYVRNTINLFYLWQLVNTDANANGSGSYAFIVDQHNVLIAYTNNSPTLPPALFKAISPLSPQTQQMITSENLYGNSTTPVKVLPAPEIAQMHQKLDQNQDQYNPITFSGTPVLQNQTYQMVQNNSLYLPWSYYVASPLSVITAAVDQQLTTTIAIASFVLVLMILIGLSLGFQITRPILLSVSALDRSSRELKKLAASEQNTVREQQWMIEGSKMGIRSLLYYSNAIDVANNRLKEVTAEIAQYQPEPQVHELTGIAHYVRNAIERQETTAKRLETAIRVTTQVTDQLASSATSAAEAAGQLEEVVRQLRKVVGQ